MTQRAPFQILVFPYHFKNGQPYYAILKRDDLKVWQGIAGGGESGERPIQSAQREANEEAGISLKNKMIQLDSITSIPVTAISGFIWGKNTIVIPEYTFGVELKDPKLKLSREHTTYEWLDYEEAVKKLQWDSNRTALWELNHRLLHKLIMQANNSWRLSNEAPSNGRAAPGECVWNSRTKRGYPNFPSVYGP